MPSKKGIDQALTWLKNKANDKNTLDAVNAELCINVIMDLQRQYDRLGAQFGNLRSARSSEEPAVMKEEQINFFETAKNVLSPKAESRTINIALNEKGDVHNEKTGTKPAGVRNREPAR